MSNPAPEPVTTHGTCIALSCAGHTAGVLLQGPSGTGKSSLALRLIDQPGFGAGSTDPICGHLVSDDQVVLEDVKGVLTATAPSAIEGLLEVRGIGIIKVATMQEPASVEMVIAHATPSEIDRTPEPQVIELAGLTLPLQYIDLSGQSSAALVRSLALVHWGLTDLEPSSASFFA